MDAILESLGDFLYKQALDVPVTAARGRATLCDGAILRCLAGVLGRALAAGKVELDGLTLVPPKKHLG